MSGLKIIVLAKQVSDTRNVGKDAMKANGTVNKVAFPASTRMISFNSFNQKSS